MIRLLLVLGLIDGLAEGLSPNRGSTNATTGSGANAGQTPDEYCQSLCGSPPSSICGDKGSYCKPYGPPQNGQRVCQGLECDHYTRAHPNAHDRAYPNASFVVNFFLRMSRTNNRRTNTATGSHGGGTAAGDDQRMEHEATDATSR
ncbi:hypothetical protein FOZ61_000764, partial [Perkinsus olseni]